MAIDRFSGYNRFLSNFWRCYVKYRGVTYLSAEHAYQAAKVGKGKPGFQAIVNAKTPGEAKRLGGQVMLPPNWDDRRLEIMAEIVACKFTQNKELARRLVETGDEELIEGNTWGDNYWGVCNGQGRNMLGAILMKVREGLVKRG